MQQALSQQTDTPGVQQAGPHFDLPEGQTQVVPFQACWPGQVTGFGVGVRRTAASAPARGAAEESPTIPSKPLSSCRRLVALAIERTTISNHRSSILTSWSTAPADFGGFTVGLHGANERGVAGAAGLLHPPVDPIPTAAKRLRFGSGDAEFLATTWPAAGARRVESGLRSVSAIRHRALSARRWPGSPCRTS